MKQPANLGERELSTYGWRRYFEQHDLMEADEVGPVALADHRAARALIRSLRRFQIGEASGARLVTEAQDPRHTFLDDECRRALVLFVGEEDRHGELLARLLGQLDAPVARWDLSTVVFRAIRRVFGFKAKLAVLLTAEVVGSAFYSTVAAAVDEPMVSNVLRRIDDDEGAHLVFVTMLLRRIIDEPRGVMRSALRRAVLIAWIRIVFAIAIVGVTVDHLPLLRRTGPGTMIDTAKRLRGEVLDELRAPRVRPLAVAAV